MYYKITRLLYEFRDFFLIIQFVNICYENNNNNST